MPGISQKVPRTLIDIYRLAAKGVKLESFYEGDIVHVISRKEEGRPYENFWAMLTPSGPETIEEEPKNGIGWKIYETIGPGYINPRAIAHLKNVQVGK